MRAQSADPRAPSARAARLQVGDRAPGLTVLDASGRNVSLTETWRHRPVVLTFLRHFG